MRKKKQVLVAQAQQLIVGTSGVGERKTRMESTGEWLEKALNELCSKVENALDFDSDMISGLVSYCQFAPPLDAKEYLDVTFSLFRSLLFFTLSVFSISNFFFLHCRFFRNWVIHNLFLCN